MKISYHRGWKDNKAFRHRMLVASFVTMFKLEQKQTTGLVSPMVSGKYKSHS